MMGLNWGALHRTIGAEHTTVAGLGAQQCFTVVTFIEKLAGIDRHRLLFGEAAMRAGQQ